jgi:hypothetical protein
VTQIGFRWASSNSSSNRFKPSVGTRTRTIRHAPMHAVFIHGKRVKKTQEPLAIHTSKFWTNPSFGIIGSKEDGSFRIAPRPDYPISEASQKASKSRVPFEPFEMCVKMDGRGAGLEPHLLASKHLPGTDSSRLIWVPPRLARLVSHELSEARTRLVS